MAYVGQDDSGKWVQMGDTSNMDENIAEVKKLFDKRGITDYDDARLARIAQEIADGKRTFTDVGKSLDPYASDEWKAHREGNPDDEGDITYTGDEDVSHVGLPGRPEIWKNTETGMAYVVYFVPGVEPELPMIWEVPNEDDLASFFGDEDVIFDREGDTSTFNSAGAISFGTVDEVVLRGENPYAGWESQFEREKEVLPFLNDPEVAAIMASAWMEGRSPTEAELASAEWFKSKTAGEQQWYIMQATQPETAKQLMASNKLAVRRQLEAAGINEPPDSMIDYIGNKWTTGLWTDEMMNNQIALFADPQKAGDRDVGLTEAIAGNPLDTTMENEQFVRDEVRKWLGPQFGQWDDGQISEWAGKLRNDPDGADQLRAELSRQRVAVLPEYADDSLTYEDIATPWRNLAFNAWGQNMDETGDTFQSILRANDSAVAGQMLREEGLNQGIKKVEDAFLSDISRSFGGGVRGYAR